MESFYDILQVSNDASDKEIKLAYKRLAKKYHPDINPDSLDAEEKFKQVNEAYGVLSNPDLRFHYDQAMLNLFIDSFAQTDDIDPEVRRPNQRPRKNYSYMFEEDRKKQRERDRFTPKKYAILFGGYGIVVALLVIFGLSMERYTAGIWYDEAMRFYRLGEHVRAMSKLRDVFEKDDEMSEAYWLYGQIYFNHMADPVNAVSYYNSAVEYAAEDDTLLTSYLMSRAEALQSMGKFNDAVIDYHSVLGIDSIHKEANFQLAQVLTYALQLGKPAEKHYRYLESQDTLVFEVALGLGVSLYQQGKYKDAKPFFHKAFKYNRLDRELDFYYGNLLLKNEQDTIGACNYWFRSANRGNREAERSIKQYCD